MHKAIPPCEIQTSRPDSNKSLCKFSYLTLHAKYGPNPIIGSRDSASYVKKLLIIGSYVKLWF